MTMADKTKTPGIKYPYFTNEDIGEYYDWKEEKLLIADLNVARFDQSTYWNATYGNRQIDEVKRGYEYITKHKKWETIKEHPSEIKLRVNYIQQALLRLASLYPSLPRNFNISSFVEDCTEDLKIYSADTIRSIIKRTRVIYNNLPSITLLVEMANKEETIRNTIYTKYMSLIYERYIHIEEGRKRALDIEIILSKLVNPYKLTTEQLMKFYSLDTDSTFGIKLPDEETRRAKWCINQVMKGNIKISIAVQRLITLGEIVKNKSNLDKYLPEKQCAYDYERMIILDEIDALMALEIHEFFKKSFQDLSINGEQSKK